MSQRTDQKQPSWISFLGLVASALSALLIFLLVRRRRGAQSPSSAFLSKPDLTQFHGLSDAEVAVRSTRAYEQAIEANERFIRSEVIRRNTLSIFNLSLVGFAFLQFLLQDPLGMVVTLATVALNIGVNIFQELYARHQVAELRAQVRPMTTVIRSGRLLSIPFTQVVVDDVILVEKGDELPTGGNLLASEKFVVYYPNRPITQRRVATKTGGQLISGGYCLSGWAIYRAEAAPATQEISLIRDRYRNTKANFTPLQRIIDRLLRFLLAGVFIFLILFIATLLVKTNPIIEALENLSELPLLDLIASQGLDITDPDFLELVLVEVRNAISVIFAVAPASLFFMIIVTYAMGAVDIGKFGAYVRKSQTIEALAQVTTLCIGRGASLTGADVQMEMIDIEPGQRSLSAQRVALILGSFAHSVTTSPNDFILRALEDRFEGQQRPTVTDFYFLTAYGWAGVVFDELDLRGTFILGHPDLLTPMLVETVSEGSPHDEPEDRVNFFRKSASSILKIIQNTSGKSETTAQSNIKENEVIVNESQSFADNADRSIEEVQASPEEVSHDDGEATEMRGWRGMLSRVGNFFRREDSTKAELSTLNEESGKDISVELLFAYLPEPQPLSVEDGFPQLPNGLIPLCKLTFIEQMRPEARQVLEVFTNAGVKVKILAPDSPERVAQMAKQLGLDQQQDVISGLTLDDQNLQMLDKIVTEADLFCELSSAQMERLVGAMRRGGEFVAMLGDSVIDESAMRRANVGIASIRSHNLTLQLADIVMVKDSIEALTAVFDKGQRIVNGLLDVLKLNLTQITYTALLICAYIFLLPGIFYYHPTQAGIATVFTVVLPSLGLTLWASGGYVPRQSIGRRLAFFVVPAAVSLTVTMLFVYYMTLGASRNFREAQLALVHLMVNAGVLLAIFVRPPLKSWLGGDSTARGRYVKDARMFRLGVVLLLIWFILISIPLAERFLYIRWLSSPEWNVYVLLIAVFWAVILQAVWRIGWLERLIYRFKWNNRRKSKERGE